MQSPPQYAQSSISYRTSDQITPPNTSIGYKSNGNMSHPNEQFTEHFSHVTLNDPGASNNAMPKPAFPLVSSYEKPTINSSMQGHLMQHNAGIQSPQVPPNHSMQRFSNSDIQGPPLPPNAGMQGPPMSMNAGMQGPPMSMNAGMQGPPMSMNAGMQGPPMFPNAGMQGPPMPPNAGMQGPSMPPNAGNQGPPMPPNAGMQGPSMPPNVGNRGPPMSPNAGMQGPPMFPNAGMQGPSKPPNAGNQGPPMSPNAGMQGPPMPPNAGMQGPPMPPNAGMQGPPMPPNAGMQGPPMPANAGMQGPPMPANAGMQGPPLSMNAGMQGPPMSMNAGIQGPPMSMNAGIQGPPMSMNAGMQGPPMPPNAGMQGPPMSMNAGMQGPPMPPNAGMQGPPMPPNAGMQGPPMSMNAGMQGPQRSHNMGTQGPHNAGSVSGRSAADQMPSAIAFMDSDRSLWGGVFATDNRGRPPPLVTTEFISQDQGVSSPKFIRSTLYQVPISTEIMKQAALPLGFVITPFASQHSQDQPIVLSDTQSLGPVRCIRCKAYMNPFMTFIDGGRRFACALCGASTEVPQEYFAHLDHTGRRTDCYQRPELCQGSYEMTVTPEYCREGQPPQAAGYVFLIDISIESARNGLLQLFCSRLKNEILPSLPRDADGKSTVQLGFVTFSDSVEFYNLHPRLSGPQVHVLADLEDAAFAPLAADAFLVDPDDSAHLIESLLEYLLSEYGRRPHTTPASGGSNFQSTAPVLLAEAVESCIEAMKASLRPGKLFVLQSSPTRGLRVTGSKPSSAADDLTRPACSKMSQLGEACVTAGVSVDLFLLGPAASLDLISLAELSRLSGGRLLKYPAPPIPAGDQLVADLADAIGREYAFDALIRVRTSAGLRPVEFYGHHFMSNTTDVEMACLDKDSTLVVEVKHDDKLPENGPVYVQAVVLFTTVSGHRRLRVHNLVLATSSSTGDIIRSSDAASLFSLVTRASIRALLTSSSNGSSTPVTQQISQDCARWLAAYRRALVSNNSAGELVLPETLKLGPLYCCSLIKADVFQSGQDVSMDDRCYLIFLLTRMTAKQLDAFLYPRLLPLHTIDLNSEFCLPGQIRCSYERLDPSGAYLLENGLNLVLWLGQQCSPQFVQDIFGVSTLAQINVEQTRLPALESPMSRHIGQIIDTIQTERKLTMRMTIIRQQDKLEGWFKRLLIEDKTSHSNSSYVEYMCHIHQEVRNMLK